ncbi:hypothetical protein Desdi_0821 [Desulfitobacterium dichloroeliminans LMG P-21439]|uniref:Uncharacterized protein n=1 Tax=Desulfitobacterium dichloroeliminans (strain LMG P-21439 / DCA1) TaxID=871963 RepID=L0F6R0_DESDL|nr:DUF6512 family protein [Desulfitobacterium dichloroeliminans]AGA68346.1 hypothetical protein Desdi_0821 [Desulfitobacterium dichloroeliminans LMG P-21439]
MGNCRSIFSPINESIWEHLKIGFWALVLFSLLEYRFIKSKTHNFFLAKGLGNLALHGLIVIVFYSYTAFTDKPIMFLDISSFVLGCILCQLVSYKILTKSKPKPVLNWLGLSILLASAALFVIFTFAPPELILFQEPSTYLKGK